MQFFYVKKNLEVHNKINQIKARRVEAFVGQRKKASFEAAFLTAVYVYKVGID